MTQELLELDRNNVEQQMAFDLVKKTNKSLFITGKAGTGKTTFIKLIQKEIDKNFLLLAPTGIAAVNVGGQTMHSFFGFPMQAIGPHTEIKLSQDNEALLREVDTIIVDEASMVRSDMVDGMDRCLRMVFHTNMAFGGKQVIFVGDLFQLPPVVKEGTADAEMLHDLYGAGLPFFYKAYVLKRMNLPKIEFQKVYRQREEDFLNILDKMRNGEIKDGDLELLNEHVVKEDTERDFSVTVTPFKYMAENINDEKLKAIEGEEYSYQATIVDDFKPNDAPVLETLKLKEGAQVIFCHNNPTAGYMNGTIGKVSKLKENQICVMLENGIEITVEKFTWQNMQSKYNRETRKMETEVVGAFTQYPLKLAWAITIHKSQGMTFDRMQFDLTRGTFQAGQAYVAVSRLRSLDGLTLSNPIRPHHVTQNQEVRAFANSFNDVSMINDELESGEAIYKYQSTKNYDMAVKTCIEQVIEKIRKSDYRNAALKAKMMFDIMLDDAILKGMTEKMDILKDCSMTCYFLNAVICLYGNRYEEAVGYADMVLTRKQCLEAMFIKGRALYELGKYDEAYDVVCQIITISKEGEEKKAIDKKLLLFEARVYEKLGNPNLAISQRLLKLCPEYMESYIMLRKEARRLGLHLDFDETEENMNLAIAFEDEVLSDDDFRRMLIENSDKKNLKRLSMLVRKLKNEL